MKTKNLFRLGALCLALALISTALLSGTFAKYATEVAGADTALVAKWSFAASDGTTDFGAIAEDISIFDHAYDTAITNSAGTNPIIAPGVEDSFILDIDYLADVDANLALNIAKTGTGTGVPIQFSLVEDGDTGKGDFSSANVIYDLGALDEAILAKYITVAGDANVISAGADSQHITLKKSAVDAATATTTSVTVYWRWPHDVTLHDNAKLLAATFAPINTATWTDADDTALGITSAAGTRSDYVLTITMTAEQIAPTVTP